MTGNFETEMKYYDKIPRGYLIWNKTVSDKNMLIFRNCLPLIFGTLVHIHTFLQVVCPSHVLKKIIPWFRPDNLTS
jgi:hypothetical protein